MFEDIEDLPAAFPAPAVDTVDALAFDRALQDLEKLDPEQARIVELRFFGGLTLEETATLLGISPSTVKREWAIAKGWLYRALTTGKKVDQSPPWELALTIATDGDPRSMCDPIRGAMQGQRAELSCLGGRPALTASSSMSSVCQSDSAVTDSRHHCRRNCLAEGVAPDRGLVP